MGKVATKRSFRQSSFALALGASYGVFCAGQAGALPGTPTVQGTGVATFTPGTNSLTVNQTSENLAIVWTPSGAGSTPTKAFDILSGETVTFMQPNTGAVAYNSISCSGCSATIIAGTLQSRLTSNPTLVGGSVWLFDPNGIVIGQGAVVNVGGFIASSLQGDIPTWLANPNNPLTINDGGGATPANGAVTNDGNITASNGVLGYVALIGNSVAATQTGATGTINVGFGSINLAAGRVATITALNGGGLNFALSTAAGDAINVNNGSATSAVAVTGPAALTGAAVTLSANVAAALFTNAVNTSGVIRAVNLDNSGGTIKLVGAGSPVVASGTLNASGSTGTDPVGTVQITGDSVSLGATTVGGALTVEATTGGIAQTGAVAAGAATFTTDTTNQTIVLSAANTFSGAVSLNTTGATGNAAIVADALNLGTSTVGGTLTATATAPAPGGGGITESGALTAAAGSSFTSATNIDLSTQANNLNNPAFVFTGATGNLGYRDINSILLPATNLHGGNITLISDTGTITQGGAINAAAGTFTTSTANEAITLGAANTFSGAVSLNTTGATGDATIVAAALDLGTSTVGGALTATATAPAPGGGGITESGALTAAAGSSFTSATNIDLSTQANDLNNPAFVFTGATGNLGYRDINSILLPATNLHGGNITLISDTGTITQGGAINAAAGTFTTSTANEAITLGAANTFSGAVSLNTTGATGDATIVAAALDLGTSTVGGALTATATAPAPGGGGITESGVLTAGTGSSFTSATNIDLSTQANDLNNPAFVFTGATGNLGYRDINSILLPATNLHGGNITLISDTGTITQGGAINAAAGTFTTSTANEAITLGAANTFSGAVSLNTTGATGDASIVAAALNLGASNVGGALTAEATTGGITQTGRITAGAATFTTDTVSQTITLGAANTFSGAVSLNTTGATGNATIVASALDLGTSNVGGTLTATATAAAPAAGITESGVLTAPTSSFTSASNINLLTQANDLPGAAFAFTGSSGNLGFQNTGNINLAATTVPGSITLISDTGTITQSGAIAATAGTFTTSTADEAITLGAANTFSGAVSLNTTGAAGNATIDAAALNLGASTVGGTLTAEATTGGITESGVLTAPTSSFASASNINLLTQANNLPGAAFALTGASGNLGFQNTGNINLASALLPGSVTLISDTGSITQGGPISATTGSFTTSTADQTITLGAANTFSGAVSLNTTGAAGNATIVAAALDLGTSTVGGTLTATATAAAPSGGITESGVLTAPASSFISASNINLSTQPNALPAPTFTFTGTTGNLGLRELASIAMAGFTVPGSITLISDTGSITQAGAISATTGSFTTSTADETITLGAANTFSGAVSLNTTGATGNATIVASALDLGTSNVGGTLTATATAAAPAAGITESGVLTAPTSSFTSASNINLLTQANDLPGAAFAFTGSSGNLGFQNTGNINLAATTVPGSITLISDTGTITQSGAIAATAGTFTTSTADEAITLGAANTFSGAVSLNTTGAAGNATIDAAALNLGASTVGGTLTAEATTGGITQTGSITAGAATFTTDTVSQTITLAAANTFSGAVSLNTMGAAGNASIVAAALNLGASTVGGTLTAEAATGGITQTGSITAGAATFTTDTANQPIALATPANAFSGPVSLNTKGAAGNASIVAAALNLGASNVGGALTAEATTGGIAQTGAIAAGAATFTTDTTNGTIALATPANAFSGPVSLNTTGATGNASIDAAALNLGTSTVGGTLTAMGTSGITESGVLTAPASSFASAGSINLLTQANNLPGATFALSGTSGNLGFQNTGNINLAATMVPGSITLISDTGSITQAGAISATTGSFTTSTADETITLGAANTFSGAVSLNTTGATGNATIDAAALNLGTSNVGGTLTATGTGGITESGVLTATTSSFASAGSINLLTQANNLGGAAFALTGTSGNLGFQNTGNINQAAITVPGSIALMSDTGSIAQGGAIAATAGTFTTSAANKTITLGAANKFSGAVSLNTTGAAGNATVDAAALNFGASHIGGTLTGTATTGAITQTGAITAGGSSFTTSAGNQTITLGAANTFNGAVSLNTTGAAGNVTIDAAALTFGASNVGGALTGTAATGGIGESGVLAAVGGTFSTLTANQGINLATQTNDFTGAVALNTLGTGPAAIKSQSLNLGASSVGGALTATSTVGDITESGVLDPSSSVFTSAGNINLGTQANVLGNVTFVFTGAAGNLNFRDADAITMAGITVPGSITLTSDTGSISETGAISASTGTFTTSAANQSINLGTQTNAFTGAVSLNTQSGGNAAIKEGALNLGASMVGGTLAATSTTGGITESGLLTATGGSTFTSAANIDLSTQTNVLGGTVVAAATNGFVDVNATQFATVDAVAKNDITLNAATGDLDHLSALTFAGNVIATAKGNMTVDGADAALTSATGNVTLTAGGTISQAFAYNAIATGVGLTSNDISMRGNTVTLNAPNLGGPGNFVGIITNNLTTANSTPGNLYFAVLTPSGQKIAPANLKINGLSALPVTPGVFLSVGKALPQTEYNIGSPAYLNFVKNYETAPTFDLGAGEVQTSAESLASALNVAANSQQGTSSVNGILGSTPDANISLFNIVGLCLPADQRDDEEAAKHKDCLPAKTTDIRLPKHNPLSDASPPILVASRSAGGAAAQELR